MQVNSVKFVQGVTALKNVPKEGIPQVAFLGRSNSGKSSLLNALFGKNIVKTSNKPGKTREINFFLLNDSIFYVDLPGVGYAKVNAEQRTQMAKRIRDYVEKAHDLKGIIYLLDLRHSGHAIDFETIEGIRKAGRLIILVGSKADKLSKSELKKARQTLSQKFGLNDLPIAVSSKTKQGLDELMHAIDTMSGAKNA